MPTIAFQIMTGPGTSRREVFDEPVISFGREAGNLIVLGEPTASRKHGELRFDDGRWVLVNLSPNGVNVNGKRVTRKPCALQSGDVISVGDAPVLQVSFDATPAAIDAGETDPGAIQPPKKKRKSLKIGVIIAVYLVLLAALALFLSTLSSNNDDDTPPAPELTPAQIREAILEPIKVDNLDPRLAQQKLEDARELFNKLDTAASNLYLAYESYQMALGYSGQRELPDGLDQRKYLQVQEMLIERVTHDYKDAYAKLGNKDFRGAEKAFRRLNEEIYRNPSGTIYKNAELQRSAAAGGIKREKRSKWR